MPEVRQKGREQQREAAHPVPRAPRRRPQAEPGVVLPAEGAGVVLFEVTIALPGEEPTRQKVEFRSERGVEEFVRRQQARIGKFGGEVSWRRPGEGRED